MIFIYSKQSEWPTEVECQCRQCVYVQQCSSCMIGYGVYNVSTSEMCDFVSLREAEKRKRTCLCLSRSLGFCSAFWSKPGEWSELELDDCMLSTLNGLCITRLLLKFPLVAYNEGHLGTISFETVSLWMSRWHANTDGHTPLLPLSRCPASLNTLTKMTATPSVSITLLLILQRVWQTPHHLKLIHSRSVRTRLCAHSLKPSTCSNADWSSASFLRTTWRNGSALSLAPAVDHWIFTLELICVNTWECLHYTSVKGSGKESAKCPVFMRSSDIPDISFPSLKHKELTE